MKNTFRHRLLIQVTYVANDLLETMSIELTDLCNEKNIVTCLYRQPDACIDDLIKDI